MKTLQDGQDKIKQICDILRKDTLEPAKKEGEQLVADAQQQAEKIINDAKKEAQRLLDEAREKVEQEKYVFQSALSQASKQSVEELKQMIHAKLFDDELYDKVVEKVKDPDVIARIITAIVSSLERDGIDTDMSAIISQTASPEEVNTLLAEGIVQALKEKSVLVGDFKGGAMVRLHGKKVILDISADALKELLASHLRKDFRTILFTN